jgi:S1-C subfamily serine protease
MIVAVSYCPRCGVRSPVRLAQGQVCAGCRSADAWMQSERMVVTRDEIAASVARRRRVPRRPILAAVRALAALALAAVAATYLVALFQAQPVRGLAQIVEALRRCAAGATLAGGAGLIVGAVSLWLHARGAHSHRRLFLAGHVVGILVGGIAGVAGGLHWLGTASIDMQHLDMPALDLAGQPSIHMDRIARATVVIVAGDAEGNARAPSTGTGTIVGRHDQRAWIATCLHVVTPHMSPAAARQLERAQPVWVQLHDGRAMTGRVVWTAPAPLDVALIEIALEAPPEPVVIAPDVDALASGEAVMFVPHPYRAGWRLHHGAIEHRQMHRTPAGPYSLVFTNLPVQPGDSGSGLFDSRGMLIGLNTWTRFDHGIPHGISLPSETLRALDDALRTGRFPAFDPHLRKEQP